MPDFQHFALHLIETYKYTGLYFSLALGLVGLPIPDETLLTFAGFKVYQGDLHFIPVLLISIAGSLTGMSLSYFIGRKIGIPFVERFGKYLHLTPDRVAKSEKWFRKYRKKSIVLGYFVPGLRHVTAYLSGISEIPYSVFLTLAFTGAVGWVALFTVLGYFVGEDWKLVGHAIHRYLWILLLVFVLLLGFYARYKRQEKGLN